MWADVVKMLSYPFIYRALIVGVLVSLCAALLGVSLVLKRYSMIGDGLSHVGFGALAVATALNTAPMKVAIPVVVLAAFFLLRLNESKKIKGDSAIALIATGSIAIGVIVISFSTGSNIDVFNYMFGSILAMTKEDVLLSVVLSVVVISIYLFFYTRILSVTFDESFAKATGINTDFYNMIIALLTAVTIVLGMRLMGSLLISSLIIFPPLSAMRIFKSYSRVVAVSAVISVICFIIGITLSYFFSLPAGAAVVSVNILVFLIFSLTASILNKTVKDS